MANTTHIKKGIADLKAQAQQLEQERQALLASWQPRAVAAEKVGAVIDQAAERYAQRLDAKLYQFAHSTMAPLDLFGPSRPGAAIDTDALCFFFAAEIKTRVLERLEHLPWQTERTQAQTERLVTLDLDRLEIQCALDDLRDQLEEVS